MAAKSLLGKQFSGQFELPSDDGSPAIGSMLFCNVETGFPWTYLRCPHLGEGQLFLSVPGVDGMSREVLFEPTVPERRWDSNDRRRQE